MSRDGDAAVHALGPGRGLADRAVLRELVGRYLVFDAFVGGVPRVALDPLVLPAPLHQAAVRAAEGVVRVLGGRIANAAHGDPSEAAHYGFHPDVTRLASASYRGGDRASLVRVDLLLDEHGAWRACEVNADCPGGHNEASGLPRLARAAGFRGGENPTVVLEALAARLADLARRPDGSAGTVGLTYCTAYAEDLQVCALIQRALGQLGTAAHLVSATALALEGGRVVAGGQRIDALYRFLPTEYLEQQPCVADLAAAVERGTLRTLSSFAEMYLQSKLVMARAWALAATLEAADRALLEGHLPETHDLTAVSPGMLIHERERWVVKRAFGRVGDEVFVGPLCAAEEWRALVNHALARRAAGERWIAQRFVPQRPIATPWGARFVTLGAYVLDGRFAGYFARITPTSHVSHDALVVPVLVAPPAAPLLAAPPSAPHAGDAA